MADNSEKIEKSAAAVDTKSEEKINEKTKMNGDEMEYP
jgi:hypothetical protein